MKYYELDKEEKEILEAFEKSEFKPLSNSKELKKYYQQIARNTSNKSKNINIRLSLGTLYRLKSKAAEEGLPYQTLAASILHKYANR